MCHAVDSKTFWQTGVHCNDTWYRLAACQMGDFASKYIKFDKKVAAKYADEIIILNRSVQEYFLGKYSRVTVFIPNWVNSPTVVEAKLLKEKWGLGKGSSILFLGRLVPEKGIKHLIEAFKNVHIYKSLS